MYERFRSLAVRLAALREKRALLVLGALLLVFLSLSLVVHWPELKTLDHAVTRWMQSRRSPVLDQVAEGLTHLGDGPVLALLGALVALGLFLSRRPWTALLCAASLLGLPLNVAIKHLVGRPRPETALVDVVLPAVGLSFPSGHTMGSTLLYGFLALLAWVQIQRDWVRGLATGFFALLACGIGLSRVYLGAHWFSDVVGGWTAGLFFLFLLAEAFKVRGVEEVAPRSAREEGRRSVHVRSGSPHRAEL
jgi:membrane-associated phospholipid phosphatase